MRIPFQGDFLSRLAVVLLTCLLLLAFVGLNLPVGDPAPIAYGPQLSPPAPGWLMRTNNLGRTMLPRVLQGIRIAFVLATAPVLITSVLAVVIGMLAGYLRGWFHELVARLADVLFAFLSLLLGLILVAIMGPGVRGITAAIILITLPLMVRVVRATTLSIASREAISNRSASTLPQRNVELTLSSGVARVYSMTPSG